MGINEIIAQGTWKAPVMESADNKLLNRLKLEREQLELGDLKTKRKTSNELAAYMRGADPASPDYVPGMRQIDPNAAFEYEGKQLAREKDRVGLRSSKVTADQGEFKLATEKYDGLRSEIAGLKDNPQLSKPLVAATLQRRVQQGLMSQELFDDMVGSLPDDPAQIRTTADGFLRSKLTPEQQYTVFAPKPVERTDGATKTMKDENPLSPGFMQPLGAPVQLQASPEAVMTDARARSEGALNRGVSMRGQDITAQGQLTTDARERAKVSQEDRKLAIAEGARTRDANDVIGLLDMLEKTDPVTGKSVFGSATSSGIGNIVDKAAGLVGVSTEGSQAGSQASAIEGMLISKMPKMSGPQSDKDVLMYRQMAGKIGDPTTPEADKRAAAQTIREINSRHAAPAAAPAASSNENAAALAWVKANPNDPRAAAIKAKLGVQ